MDNGDADSVDAVGFQSAFARALAQASVRRSKHSQALQLAAPQQPDAAPADENINQQLKEVSPTNINFLESATHPLRHWSE
jgi:hypothetical protein